MSDLQQTYAGNLARAVVVWCIAVLTGWEFDITFLKSVWPGLIAMNPFTAISFIAIALWQLLSIRYGQTRNPLAFVFTTFSALFVLASGAFKIFDLVTQANYSLDHLLFASSIGASHMSPLTAFNLVMLGGAMLACGIHRRRHNLMLALLTPVFTLAMMSLFGYIIGTNNIDTLKPFKPIALNATICFLILTFCFLLLFPDNVLVKRYQSRDLGGYVVRQLLPYIFGVPFTLGFLCYQGVRNGLYDTGFGISIFFISYILMALLIVVWQSMAVSNIDQHRLAAEGVAEQRSAELERANSELEKRNQELEQFAFAASHDMQEPLRKIHSFSSYLLQQKPEQLDARSREYLDKINQSTQRMKHIIEDLLNYSHHTRGEDANVPTDLNTVVDSIENDLELLIREKGATIHRQALPTIPAAPIQMHQLFMNLIGNALKFSRPQVPPQVHISCRNLGAEAVAALPGLEPNRTYVEIMVADNGIGFLPEYAEQIFGLFKRLHNKSAYEGTGIGLALCKKVADNHQGHIWAESEPGRGATFHVVLPAD